MADEISFDQATLLIGLGAPRTGSKWLSNYFTQHNEILMSPIRILHYFDPTDKYNLQFESRLEAAEARVAKKKRIGPPSEALELLRERVRMIHDPSGYLDYFRTRWSGQKVFADITPSYYIAGRDAFARMRDAHPQVKFLFVLRNPIDRLWSQMRLAHMNDPSFDPLARLDRLAATGNTPWPRNYATALTELDTVVPSGDLRVCFFEEMFDMKAIAELCGFLGVTTQAAAVDTPMNQSEGATLDAERRGRLYALVEPVYAFVRDRFAGRLPDSWLADMERFGAG
ncbi:MAG: sulfotransferase [Caulobacteraceae bacterium]